MRHGTYIGSQIRLQGRTALIRPVEGTPNCVLAQFDDMNLEEAFNWWFFDATDFELDPEESA